MASARADSEPDDSLLERVLEFVGGYRGAERTLERAQDCVDAATRSIEPFVDCEAKSALAELAQFVATRRT